MKAATIRFRGLLFVLALSGLVPERAFATTLSVNTLVDSDAVDGLCSLREAIVAANTNAPSGDCPAGSDPGDRITFAVTGTILLGADLPAVTEGIGIIGPGRDLLTIDGDQSFRIFSLGGTTLETYLIRDLRLTRGIAPGGGCLALGAQAETVLLAVDIDACTATNGGGGVQSAGTLRIEDSWIHDNVAQGPSGGGGVRQGAGNLTLLRSALTGNQAQHTNGIGGGLLLTASSRVEISASTFSGNVAGSAGGAIRATSTVTVPLTLTIDDTTILANESNSDALSSQVGGGIHLTTDAGATIDFTLTNSLVAQNLDHTAIDPCPDVFIHPLAAITVVSGGFNLIGDNTCVTTRFPASPGAGTANAQGDFVGTGAAPLDPRMDALADNGGSTPTHGPLAETPHPVIDQGHCPTAEQDQRGYGSLDFGVRRRNIPSVPNNPAGDGCDIGAYEAGGVPDPTVTIFADDFESATALFWSLQSP